MATTETLQAWLNEAETALHALSLGKQRVSASYDGKSVNYTPADIPQLRAYIAELRQKLGQSPRAPLGVSF